MSSDGVAIRPERTPQTVSVEGLPFVLRFKQVICQAVAEENGIACWIRADSHNDIVVLCKNAVYPLPHAVCGITNAFPHTVEAGVTSIGIDRCKIDYIRIYGWSYIRKETYYRID